MDKTTRELGLLLVGFFILFEMISPGRFLSFDTFESITLQLPELGIFSLAMFVVLIAGGLNLSIVYSSNLSALLSVWLIQNFLPTEAGHILEISLMMIAFSAGFILSVIIGVVIGQIVVKTEAHPILVTLGMMIFLKGVGIFLTQGKSISGLPESFVWIGNGFIFGIPVAFIVLGIATLMLHLYLKYHPLGYSLYLIGSNSKATAFSGIDVKRALVLSYVISSLLATLAGIVMSARFNAARVGFGESYLLITILIAILGGTNPLGGSGKVFHLLLALLVFGVMSSGLNYLGVHQHLSFGIWGLVLLMVLSLKASSWKIKNIFSKRRKHV